MHHPHNDRSTRLVAVLLFALLSVSPKLSSQAVNSTPAAQDPDIPDFARHKVNKEEFMMRRDEAIATLRGVEMGKPYDPTKRIQAIRQMEEQRARLASMANSPERDALLAAWTEIGPNPIPNGQVVAGPQLAVSGRTIAIAVHPTNPNIVYVGTAQGGLYRTTDGGTNWTPLMDNALSLAIGAIAVAPSSPDIVYVGTGEQSFSCDSYFGVGIYRITNASTASPTVSGPFGVAEMSGRAVGEIVIDPANPSTIFATTTSGIGGIGCQGGTLSPSRGLFRSTNATDPTPTFTKLTVVVAGENLDMVDLAIDPASGNRLLVSVIGSSTQSGVWLSTNALAVTPAFTRQLALTGTSSSTARTELAINNVGGTVTAFAASASAGGTVHRSTDGGTTWTLQVDNNFCGQQCFYDIAIAVDPTDATKVYLGGDPTLAFGRSTDSGVTFTANATTAMGLHVDSHAIAVAPSQPATIYFGSDGGIYKSTNSGATWASLNNTGFRATQFMGISVHPTDPNFTIGGTQDNGTNMYGPSATWNRVDFGDGGYSVIDQSAVGTTTVNMFHTYFNASSLQGYGFTSNGVNPSEGTWTFRGCQSSGSTVNGITCNGTILFYAPLEQGPGTPNTLYYGSDRLYRSDNTGVTHTVVSQNPIATGVPISAIGISPQNDNVRIVGLRNGDIYGTSTGSSPLVNLDPSGTVPNNFVARAVVDPNNQTTAYVTLSAFGVVNVWKTTNLSAAPPTWVAAAGTGGTALPLVPVNAFVVDPSNANALFAGTDIGVYVSTDAGTSWLPYGTGLPAVAVFDMVIHPLTRTLRIATHGRGMWEIGGLAPLPVQIASFTATPYRQWHALLAWRTLTELNNYGFEVQRGLDRRGPFGTIAGGFVPGHGTTNEPHDYSCIDTTGEPRTWFYRLKQIDLDGSVHYTEAIGINTLTSVFVETSPTEFGLGQNYPNPFNPSTTINFHLPRASNVLLRIFSALGQQVATLASGRHEAGVYHATWNAENMSSGIYYYKLEAEGFTATKKLLLVK